MKAYVQFEIAEGAYDISCPDAQCPSQGVLQQDEIKRLVGNELAGKHLKYRINRGPILSVTTIQLSLLLLLILQRWNWTRRGRGVHVPVARRYARCAPRRNAYPRASTVPPVRLTSAATANANGTRV